jgi:hypothetical protein
MSGRKRLNSSAEGRYGCTLKTSGSPAKEIPDRKRVFKINKTETSNFVFERTMTPPYSL